MVNILSPEFENLLTRIAIGYKGYEISNEFCTFFPLVKYKASACAVHMEDTIGFFGGVAFYEEANEFYIMFRTMRTDVVQAAMSSSLFYTSGFSGYTNILDLDCLVSYINSRVDSKDFNENALVYSSILFSNIAPRDFRSFKVFEKVLL